MHKEKMNLKGLIIKARDTKVTEVDVPEWNTKVYLKELSVKDRHDLLEQVTEANEGKLGVYVLLHTLSDADGNLVFTKDEYNLLADKNVKVIDRLAKLAYEVNGMKAGAVDEAKKN
jgi:hypothetical protein